MTVKSRASYSPIPEALVAAAAMAGTTIADEITAYRVRLRAENKSRATVSLWAGAARQLQAYLVSDGMPTDVAAIRREHLEEWPGCWQLVPSPAP